MAPSVSAASENSFGFNRYYILDIGDRTIIELMMVRLSNEYGGLSLPFYFTCLNFKCLLFIFKTYDSTVGIYTKLLAKHTAVVYELK